jgi:anti-sigma regulatory factor (Ser/Thr protein kinase)
MGERPVSGPVPVTSAALLRVTAFQRSYPGLVRYVRRVRSELASFAGGCPRGDDLIMVASELAANAVQHSRSGEPGREFTVRAHLYHGDYAWLEVEDQGGPWADHEPGDERGRGLTVVGALAGAGNWGIDETSSSNRVAWARLGWTEPS